MLGDKNTVGHVRRDRHILHHGPRPMVIRKVAALKTGRDLAHLFPHAGAITLFINALLFRRHRGTAGTKQN